MTDPESKERGAHKPISCPLFLLWVAGIEPMWTSTVQNWLSRGRNITRQHNNQRSNKNAHT